jgi:demethylmenaquinone methyltransferase/2-methoxy-6-polyprenyl-1,4-benzoquinol methylase
MRMVEAGPEHARAAPHPPLRKYYRAPADRPGYVQALFDRTAGHYDRINALMSLGAGRRYRREMLVEAGLRPGMRVLDIAIGTGLVAREARHLLAGSGRVVGLDVSAGMLAEARRLGAADDLVQACAEALPFREAAFDLVSVGYALRHVADLEKTFRELGRVLRPGGSLLLLELTEPEDPLGRAVLRLYLARIVPLVSLLATGSGDALTLMRYNWATIAACVPPADILDAMSGAGLAGVRSEVQYGVLRAYIAKRP